jgi:hypothetical protein
MGIIKQELNDLAEKCEKNGEPLTQEQLECILTTMAHCAIAALMDTAVAKEAEEIAYLANP